MQSVVHNSFQNHRFVNSLFRFSIIVQKNSMIQIASCQRAFIAYLLIPKWGNYPRHYSLFICPKLVTLAVNIYEYALVHQLAPRNVQKTISNARNIYKQSSRKSGRASLRQTFNWLNWYLGDSQESPGMWMQLQTGWKWDIFHHKLWVKFLVQCRNFCETYSLEISFTLVQLKCDQHVITAFHCLLGLMTLPYGS